MIYLNYAALCPTLSEAEEEVARTLTAFKRHLYSKTGLEWYLRKIRECRQTVATLLHVNDPSNVAFTTNASTAHYLTLSSLTWNPGDAILTTTHENPSIATQLRTLEHEGIHVQTVRPTSPRAFLEELEKGFGRPGVKALVMSHVSHVDGRVFPVREAAALARARHCLVIIDGAQAVGHIPVDLQALDYDVYFFAGHKWCAGPLGTGALVVRDGTLTPPRSRAIEGARFEIGTHNVGLIAGLAKACEQRHRQGIDTKPQWAFRETAKARLGRHCRFLEWEGPQAPGILTFKGPDGLDHGEFADRLESESGIIVKSFTTYPEDDAPAIRLSWSPTMNQQDFQNGVATMARRLES